MTDNEIIKALEHNASKCKFYEDGHDCGLFESTLELIKRQKAEIESLKNRKTELQIRNQELQHEKSEAIKEFVERLKENYCFTDRLGKIITKSTVDNLIKEMTEVNENE